MKNFIGKWLKFFVFFLVLSLIWKLSSNGRILFLTINKVTLLAFLSALSFFSLIFILGGFKMFFKTSSKGKDNRTLPPLSKEKEKHYLKAGLSLEDIDFFRDTMNQARLYILLLENNMNQTSKLRAINMRTHAVRAAKAAFKQIVDNPQKLHVANHFLYTHLPNLVKATDDFLTIDSYSLKNKEVYQSLEEATQIIEQLSQLITNDYHLLMAEDLDQLEKDLAVAKNTLNKSEDENT